MGIQLSFRVVRATAEDPITVFPNKSTKRW
jgi:hypothetical protein